MAFYLLDDKNSKELLSNEGLKKKLLTHTTSPILDKEEELRAVQETELFYKKINYTIPKYTIDNCIDLLFFKERC